MQLLLALVRDNLKKYKPDILGTAYFDDGLDRLSDQYGNDGCKYYVIEDDHGQVIGGGCDVRSQTYRRTKKRDSGGCQNPFSFKRL